MSRPGLHNIKGTSTYRSVRRQVNSPDQIFFTVNSTFFYIPVINELQAQEITMVHWSIIYVSTGRIIKKNSNKESNFAKLEVQNEKWYIANIKNEVSGEGKWKSRIKVKTYIFFNSFKFCSFLFSSVKNLVNGGRMWSCDMTLLYKVEVNVLRPYLHYTSYLLKQHI